MKKHDPIRGYCMPCYNGRHEDCRETTPGNTICCGCGHFDHVDKSEWPEWIPPKLPPPVERPKRPARPEGVITGGWGDDDPESPPVPPRKRIIRRR